MTVVDGGPGGGGLVARIKNILLTPKTEWDVIDAELAAIGGLYTKYVCILAAIPAVAGLIGAQLFGIGLPGIATYKPPLVGSVVTALVTYLLSLAAVYVLALIIDALAPSFNGTKNQTQAFKVAAYSYTAAWVAGVFNILPALSILVILGSLYGLYLLYLGLPKLMKAPAEKAISYTVVVVVAAFVVSLVIGMIVGSISAAAIGMSGLNRIAANTAATGGVLSVGGQKVDLGKLEQASKQMEQTARQMQSGQSNALPVEALQTALPATLGGFTRTEVTTNTAGAFGAGAEARYEQGDAHIQLTIADTAAAGALAAMGSAFGVQHSKQTATGYEKVGMVGGRMTTEEYDSQSKHGQYGVVFGNRFMVNAEGDNVDMNALKAAVNGVNVAALEAMARAKG